MLHIKFDMKIILTSFKKVWNDMDQHICQLVWNLWGKERQNINDGAIEEKLSQEVVLRTVWGNQVRRGHVDCSALQQSVVISSLTAILITKGERIHLSTLNLMTYPFPSQKAMLTTKTEIHLQIQHKWAHVRTGRLELCVRWPASLWLENWEP